MATFCLCYKKLCAFKIRNQLQHCKCVYI